MVNLQNVFAQTEKRTNTNSIFWVFLNGELVKFIQLRTCQWCFFAQTIDICAKVTNLMVLWLIFEEGLVKALLQWKSERLNENFLSMSVGIEHAMHFPKERKNVQFVFILRILMCANSQFPKIIIFAKIWCSTNKDSNFAKIVLAQWSYAMRGSVASFGRRIGWSSCTNKMTTIEWSLLVKNGWHRTCVAFFRKVRKKTIILRKFAVSQKHYFAKKM